MKEGEFYVYKITFEEVPHFYFGVRKCPEGLTPEQDSYLGSPSTHKVYWEIYTPKKQIFREFESWREALEWEASIIRENWKDFYCLNEACGGQFCQEKASTYSSLGKTEIARRRREVPGYDEKYREMQKIKGERGLKVIKKRAEAKRKAYRDWIDSEERKEERKRIRKATMKRVNEEISRKRLEDPEYNRRFLEKQSRNASQQVNKRNRQSP